MGFFRRRDPDIEALKQAVHQLAQELATQRESQRDAQPGRDLIAEMTTAVGTQFRSLSEFVASAIESQARSFKHQTDLLSAIEERDRAREAREEERRKKLRDERKVRAAERLTQGRDPAGRILPRGAAPPARECPLCQHGEGYSGATREQVAEHIRHRNARATAHNGNGAHP